MTSEWEFHGWLQGEKQMPQEKLQFVIANNPASDFELVLEVEIDGWTAADIHAVNGQWVVTFFPSPKQETGGCELPWEIFQQIFEKFRQFMREAGKKEEID
jgi:peroxiredoxin